MTSGLGLTLNVNRFHRIWHTHRKYDGVQEQAVLARALRPATANATAIAAADAAFAAAMARIASAAVKVVGDAGSNSMQALVGLAKVGHVADTWFTGNETLLAQGNISAAEFECASTRVALFPACCVVQVAVWQVCITLRADAIHQKASPALDFGARYGGNGTRAQRTLTIRWEC